LRLRVVLASIFQLVAAERATAQQITRTDFRTPVRFFAELSVDAAAITGVAVVATNPLGWVALAVGGVGKAYFMKVDIDEKKRQGATTTQALRDVLTPAAVASAMPEFKVAKAAGFAYVKATGNTLIGKETDRLYEGLQQSFFPYGGDPNKQMWRESQVTVTGRTGGGTGQGGKCETSLPKGSEVYALAREVASGDCRTDGLPDSRSATYARVAALCSPRGGYALALDVVLQRINERQISVQRNIRIGGQWATTTSMYELCDPQGGSGNASGGR